MPIYMKLEGIEGLSRPGHYAGWHEVTSLAWSMNNTAGGGGSSGFTAMGRIQVGDINFTKGTDKSSALFIQNCTTGKHMAKVEINFTAGTQQSQKYAVMTLEHVLISSYSVSCDSENFPVEAMTLSFTKYALEFSKLDPESGKIEAGAKFAYDIKAAKV
ncbi:MAG TPA: type VI secretion system tube protein Hcp [Planctomycetota bacterium]|nr:type VI secretion system tube protein Hcp [Planctomycetota bacterium]